MYSLYINAQTSLPQSVKTVVSHISTFSHLPFPSSLDEKYFKDIATVSKFLATTIVKTVQIGLMITVVQYVAKGSPVSAALSFGASTLFYVFEDNLKGRLSHLFQSYFTSETLLKTIRVGIFVLFLHTVYTMPIVALTTAIALFAIHRVGLYFATHKKEFDEKRATENNEANDRSKVKDALILTLPGDMKEEVCRRLPSITIVFLSLVSKHFKEVISQTDSYKGILENQRLIKLAKGRAEGGNNLDGILSVAEAQLRNRYFRGADATIEYAIIIMNRQWDDYNHRPQKVAALCRLASAQTKAHDKVGVKRTLELAKSTHQIYGYNPNQMHLALTLSKLLAENDDESGALKVSSSINFTLAKRRLAKKDIRGARSAINNISEYYSRVLLLCELAEYLAKNQDKYGAEELLNQADQAMKEMQNRGQGPAPAINDMCVRALIQANVAVENYVKAKVIAFSLQDSPDKVKALLSIAQGQLENHFKIEDTTYDAARTLADNLRGTVNKIQAGLLIAKFHIKRGEKENAFEVLENAKENAEVLPLIGIAALMIQCDKHDEAKAALGDATLKLQQLQNINERVENFIEIATLYAIMGHFDDAKGAANLIQNFFMMKDRPDKRTGPCGKAQALIATARLQAQKNKAEAKKTINLARDAVLQIDPQDDDGKDYIVHSLIEMVQALWEMKEFDEARKLREIAKNKTLELDLSIQRLLKVADLYCSFGLKIK